MFVALVLLEMTNNMTTILVIFIANQIFSHSL